MKIKIALLVIVATTVACADSPEKQAQNYYKRCGAHEPKPGSNIVFVGGSRATVVDIQMRKNTTMPPQILVVIDGALASFDCTEIKQ